MFTQHPKLKESHPQDIEISISPRDKDILKELLELSSTTQDVDAPWSKSISGIHINISTTLNISSLPKELIPDNICSAEEKQLFQQVTFSPSTESPKEPPSATSSHQLETKAHIPDVQAPTPPSSDTPMMAAGPESDFHPAQERPSQASVELPSVSLPVEEETKSQSWRLVTSSTNTRD